MISEDEVNVDLILFFLNSMATCPRCKKPMDAMAAFCPHCNYDFPTHERKSERRGIAYSGLADLALVVGMVAAALGCISALFTMFMALLDKQISLAFMSAITFFVLLALYVVFQRVANMD